MIECELTPHDQEILAFERDWWRLADVKPAAVRHRSGISVTDYHRMLNTVIDQAGALAHDPLLVRRLRRQRERRRAHRSSRLA